MLFILNPYAIFSMSVIFELIPSALELVIQRVNEYHELNPVKTPLYSLLQVFINHAFLPPHGQRSFEHLSCFRYISTVFFTESKETLSQLPRVI